MMDDKLFRGVRADGNGFIIGWFCIYHFSTGKLRPAIIDWKKANENIWTPVEVMPDSVDRCTGLTDKNGIPIFENDIVMLFLQEKQSGKFNRGIYFLCKPTWDGNHCRFYFRLKNKAFVEVDGRDGVWEYEVIGNMHESPVMFEWPSTGCNKIKINYNRTGKTRYMCGNCHKIVSASIMRCKSCGCNFYKQEEIVDES